MVIFLDIETFKTFRKEVSGSDTRITNALWKNLQLKWTFPLDAGNIRFDDEAELGQDEDQGAWVLETTRASNLERGISQVVLPKPAMFTSKNGSEVAVYSLDFIIDPESSRDDAVINPDVDDNGNDKIKKLESEDGLDWEEIITDGVVTEQNDDDPPVPEEFKPANILLRGTTGFGLRVTIQNVFLAPFLLFNKDDIA